MAERIFLYGSLLHPASLSATVPDLDHAELRPAKLPGHRRVFDVAFPNDGSQPDKSYLDRTGGRPPFVLFANLRAHPGTTVNGLLMAADDTRLAALRDRERRYELTEVVVHTAEGPEPAHVFLGASAFTSPGDVARGVVSVAYLDLLISGAVHWGRRWSGFDWDFLTSTDLPGDRVLRQLSRHDREPGVGTDPNAARE